MSQFHRLISKRLWFILFNVGSLIYLAVTNRLHWDIWSVVGVIFAFALMNFVAWLSSRNFPEWK